MSINASFVGRLTRNPEQRQLQSGTQVVSFTVAVDSTRKGQDGNYLTTFVRVTVWGNRGNFVLEHFVQGDPISVAGELIMREYQDRNGNNRQSLEMTADRVELVPQTPHNRQPNQGQPMAPQNNAPQAPQGNPQQYMGNLPQGGQNFSQQHQNQNNGYQNNVPNNGQEIDLDPNNLPF